MTTRKSRLTAQQRKIRLYQIVFVIISAIVVISMILSLVIS
ncbi:MAG: hypothetical protein N2049_10880 [Anaerolineales bacterium]|nr:hypothetical protein [Anaerolineales bacterium]MCX7609704.1 hypothetical protein [Anaerolineales bacterium]MDW8227549.1 hypothetical protein [Anaerolineales bacterium]